MGHGSDAIFTTSQDIGLNLFVFNELDLENAAHTYDGVGHGKN
ncbi:MAG TPA: hypothetical protein VNI77_11140 [Nitrososphaera sp.]|nr:hypothetical protein [Nitrososphaera sp.]